MLRPGSLACWWCGGGDPPPAALPRLPGKFCVVPFCFVVGLVLWSWGFGYDISASVVRSGLRSLAMHITAASVRPGTIAGHHVRRLEWVVCTLLALARVAQGQLKATEVGRSFGGACAVRLCFAILSSGCSCLW